MTADCSPPSHSPSPPVEVRWVDAVLRQMWQIGYIIDGEFRPFAGGTSEEALQMLVSREMARTPRTSFSDRRKYTVERRKW